uniref:Serine/arginine-rich splicing factor 2 n=1 Tax=Anopheles christyi TaxID=43041 RepID=A0A182KDZ4_9DIPT
MDHRISKCRGFGFVHFRNKNEAMAAVQGLHGKHRFPDGKLLLVSVMQKNVLFVKNLHTNVKWHQLFRLFATQGRVKYANVIIDERGIDRGYSSGMATVCFHKSEDAAKAIEAMNDIHIFGRRLCVEYFKTKYELRKEKFDYYKRGVPCIARKEVVHRTFGE